MTLAVFFPSLMGVGILVSGALLISDWVRRLLPQGQIRRQHNVVAGTYGAVTDAIDAAGYRLAEPWFLHRGLRHRRTYVLIALVAVIVGAVAVSGGLAFYDDPRGLFYKSPWVIGIGYGVGAAGALLGIFCLTIVVLYNHLPRLIRRVVEETTLGRFVLPSPSDHVAALSNIERRN